MALGEVHSLALRAHSEQEEEIGTILCAERWCCLSGLLGYWAHSWTGRRSDTVYQHAGTHFADLGILNKNTIVD